MKTKPPVAPAAHVLSLPGWTPARLNQLINSHWATAARLKARDRKAVALAAALAGTPKAAGKRRVTIRVTLGPRMRGGDVDAYQKSCLDAMVHAGLLRDDNRQWCEIAPVEYDRGPARGTTITLEDIT